MNVIATWTARCDRRWRLLPLMGEFYWDTQCVLIASWSALDLHWQETSEAPGNSAPNWGKNATKMIICVKHTQTRARACTQTHTIGQGVFHYLLQRSMTRKEKCCCYPTMKGLVVTSGFGSDGSCLQPSQHQFSHMWPMIECKVKKSLSKGLNNNTKNCARYFTHVTVTTLIAPPL